MSLCLAIQLYYLSEIKNYNIPSPLQNSNWYISPLILFFPWHQPHQLPMDPWWMSHGVLGPVTQIVGKVPCMNVLCLWPCEFVLERWVSTTCLSGRLGKRHGNKFRVGDEFKSLDTDSFLKIPDRTNPKLKCAQTY